MISHIKLSPLLRLLASIFFTHFLVKIKRPTRANGKVLELPFDITFSFDSNRVIVFPFQDKYLKESQKKTVVMKPPASTHCFSCCFVLIVTWFIPTNKLDHIIGEFFLKIVHKLPRNYFSGHGRWQLWVCPNVTNEEIMRGEIRKKM